MVFGCALLKLFVGVGVLMKWNHVKWIGSAYLVSALIVVYGNELSSDALSFVGALGALQFV